MPVPATYPTYPQPILTHPTTGQRWFLSCTNGGVVRPEATTTDAATDLPRVTLVTGDRLKSFRLGLTASSPPSLTLTAWPAMAGGRDWISLWSPNGREWQLQIDTQTGVPTLKALGTEWPRQAGPPIVTDTNGLPWQVGVSSGQLLQATSDASLTTRRSGNLLSQDGTTAWQIQVDPTGIITTVELARNERTIYLRSNTSASVYQVTINDADLNNPLLVLSGPVAVAPTYPIPTILAKAVSPPTLYQLQVTDLDPANPLLVLQITGTTVTQGQPANVADEFIFVRSATSGVRYLLTATGADTVLQVQTADLAPGDPSIYSLLYDLEVDVGDTRYQIQIDQNGVLYVDSITDLLNARDEWPLVIAQHGNYLYIADSRFPPPIPAVPRRWGQRRRVPRRP